MVRLVILFLTVWLIPAIVIAGEEFEEIKRLKDINPSIVEDVKKAVEGFLKPDEKMIREAQSLADTTKSISKDATDGNVDVYSDLKLPKVLDNGKAKKCLQVDEDFKNTFLYFYSHSMPDASIKEALRTIVEHNRQCRNGRQAVLVVNGFKDNSFLEAIKAMHKIMDELKLTDDLPIQMNPDLFAKYDVKQVPQMVIETKEAIGRIKGDISVSYMIETLDRAVSDYGRYGNLYEIKEQSVVEFMQAKIAEALEKFKEKAPEIAKKAMILSKYDGRFEKAKEDKVFHINPSIILTEDIADLNGKVLFPAGTVIDPTEHIALSGKYLIIDGNDESQVEYARDGVFEKIMIASGDASQVMKKIKKRVYFVNDLIIQRFSISRLPSIIEQEGRLIRVTEKAL